MGVAMTPEAEAARARALELASRIRHGVDDEPERVDLLHAYYLAEEEFAAAMRGEIEQREGLTAKQITARREDRDERRRLVERHGARSFAVLKHRLDVAASDLDRTAAP
jgi:hypothetical protein